MEVKDEDISGWDDNDTTIFLVMGVTSVAILGSLILALVFIIL